MTVQQEVTINVGGAVEDAFRTDAYDATDVIETLARLHTGGGICGKLEERDILEIADTANADDIDGAIALLGRIKAAKAGA